MTRKIVSLFLLICLLGCPAVLTGCGSNSGKTPSTMTASDYDVPDDVAKVRNKALRRAKKYAVELEGSFVDSQNQLIGYFSDDSALESSQYQQLQATLREYVANAKADRMYVLSPDEEGNFRITIDSAQKPESWLKDMGTNHVYKEAYEADLVAAERSGWQASAGHWCWTAYAPLYSSEGQEIAILAVDYPADILADYPEWDRNSESWNGLEK